mmetsp:Transcript_2478/g.3628  ORF Transcript_2478/g.3628 Transcript_2478/m.3628 type:complete len:969 (-) Transcript_2478:1192-4098(-)
MSRGKASAGEPLRFDNLACSHSYKNHIRQFCAFVDNGEGERVGKAADGIYVTKPNVEAYFRFKNTIGMSMSVAKQCKGALKWFSRNVEEKNDNYDINSPGLDDIIKEIKEREKAGTISRGGGERPRGKNQSTNRCSGGTSARRKIWSDYCDWVDTMEGTERAEDGGYLTRDNIDKFFSDNIQNRVNLSPDEVKKMKSDLQWCALNNESESSEICFVIDSLKVEEAIKKHAKSFRESEGTYPLDNEDILLDIEETPDRVPLEIQEDKNDYYIEEEAHLYHNPPLPSYECEGIAPEDLKEIPPPEPLPPFPNTGKCHWKFDEMHRVLLVDFSASSRSDGKFEIELEDERFFLQMLERNDIAVISEGLVSTESLDPELWKLQHMQNSLGKEYYHKFRRFDTSLDQNGFENCKEVDSLLSMKIEDYIEYLNKRQNHLSQKLEDPSFTFIDHEGKEKTINDVGISALYMIDMDMIKSLPGLHSNFMKSFRFRDLLPGGSYCMMNKVAPNARPFMGPNMYVTPPASFTHFHQDGHGTVDSGHLCLNGYNEVIMLRRLTERHKKHALMILTGNLKESKVLNHTYFDGLYQVPHGDELGEKPAWPTVDKIEECRKMGYCPTVLILKPGQLIHINKGRLHAFRKMSTAPLPDDDCHRALREKLIKERNIVGEQLCISIAWDWMFLGVTARGVNREVLTVLEAAILNRKNGKMSLAIPEMSLLQMAKFLPERKDEELPTDVNNMIGFLNNDLKEVKSRKVSNMIDIYSGILPGLQHVVLDHVDAIDSALEVQCQQVECEVIGKGEKVTIAERPNTHENPDTSAVDPYGNDDFFCKICNKELSNVYFSCDGCEKLLAKDFNICKQCHAEKNFMISVQMHPLNPKRHGSLNHTGNFNYSRTVKCPCKNGPVCRDCSFCLGCSCRCHTWFTLRYRLYNKEEETKLVDRVTKYCTENSPHFNNYFDPIFIQKRLAVVSRKYD